MSDDSIVGPMILQIVLVIINAFLACAEIAIASSNTNQLESMGEEENLRAKRLLRLLEDPSRFLSTIQMGMTLSGFAAGVFAAYHFTGPLTDWVLDMGVGFEVTILENILLVLLSLILSYFMLVFGNWVPKRVIMKNPEGFALSVSGLISIVSKVSRPFVWILTKSTNGILRLLGIDPNAQKEEVTEEDIRMMVDQGSEKGSINPSEQEMIHNIFEFDNKDAEDVMTHRTEVCLLWLDETQEEWEKTIYENRHTYYPVCHESSDNIIGVLNTKDYFRLKDKSRQNVLENALRPAYFVPETVRTDILFHNMKQSRNHFAVVMDEYGGMTGIISINDLLEQLVGDLEDDDSIAMEPPLIERIDSSTWNILGCAPLKMIAEQLDILLPEDDDYDTFGGFVFSLLGAIPADGSTPELETFGMQIKVTEIKDHRLEKAIVYLQPQPTHEKEHNE